MEPLFIADFMVDKFHSFKNKKVIRMKKHTRQRYVASNDAILNAKNELILLLIKEKVECSIYEPINCDITVKFTFIFPKKKYFTTKGYRNKKLPDLSNLYQLYEDVLQHAGVIKDDNLICSHDGSRRTYHDKEFHVLRIEVLPFVE